jgi:hypothetical protein
MPAKTRQPNQERDRAGVQKRAAQLDFLLAASLQDNQ